MKSPSSFALVTLAILSVAFGRAAGKKSQTGGVGGCAAITLNSGLTVNAYVTDQYVWYDSDCKQRSVALVRADTKGGHAKQFTYQLADGTVRTVNESPSAGGFGYIVSHLRKAVIATRNGEDDSPFGSNQKAQYRSVFVGKHHAIHEFTLNYPRWGVDPLTGKDTKYDVPVTIHWLFATGRNHPLWSATFDLSQAPADAVDADTRAPYGDMLFDGSATGTYGDDLGGVAWGEKYRFTTTGNPFTLKSSWDWSVTNTWAPYNLIWTTNVDAEMGIVGTLVSSKQDAGGYEGLNGRGFSSANLTYQCQADGYTMPCTWGWPYQSVNFSFADVMSTTYSKRLAWGADWGYLGQKTIQTINGNTVSGWPKVSYSVYIVLGPHSKNPTTDMAQQAAAIDSTTLTATVGTLVTQGPAGVNRTDTVTYSPAGYNPIYGTWEANEDNGRSTLSFSVGEGVSLQNPVIVLHKYTGNTVPASVTLNGAALQSEVDYFASYRADTQDLWLTLNKSLSGNQTLSVQDSATSLFSDVPKDYWAYDYIVAIYNAKITQGCGNGKYCPEDIVTREQMAAFIIRALEGDRSASYCNSGSPFLDVTSSNIFCGDIKRLSELGITAVTGSFYPRDLVTRGQMAAFIIRANYGETFSYTTIPYFSDVPTTHAFFKYVQKLKDQGITKVSGAYSVDRNVTRAEMAAFLSRAFLKLP